MSFLNTDGIVLRESAYRETDKLLTVLTRGGGKITVRARGARRVSGSLVGASQFLAYSDMKLYVRGASVTLDEANVRELFFGVRTSLGGFKTAAYFAELCDKTCAAGDPGDDALDLLLRALYELCLCRRPLNLVKAAFELKLACISGFAPVIGGKTLESDGLSRELTDGAASAARYIINAATAGTFAFELGGASAEILADVCEDYIRRVVIG